MTRPPGHGDGSIYKRKDGYWAGAFYTGTTKRLLMLDLGSFIPQADCRASLTVVSVPP